MDFWSDFLQNLMMAFVPVIASALTAVLFALAKKYWAQFKSYQPDVADAMEWAARIAVQAAEQAGAAQLVGDKKEYALEVAEKWLHMKGFKTVDLDALDAAVEAAVFDVLNSDKQQLKPHIGLIQ